jgi:ubiquinone/menaquinone biosynthesis C-methylase UbiE/DNA-binding transcriptional ArsR family regulator
MNAGSDRENMTNTSLEWLQTLADTTRVRLLAILSHEELSVSEMCAILQLPQSTISRHLKVLSADGWIESRREGTNQLYSRPISEWNDDRSELWDWVSKRQEFTPTKGQDFTRLNQILSERSRSEAFLSSSAQQWDRLRIELFGSQLDAFALAAALPSDAVVAELGCGSAPLAQLVAPYVKEVVAIDSSAAMLAAAKEHLKEHSNIRFQLANLTELPMENCFDAAWLVLVLPYVREPAEVLRESARTLKASKPLVIIDLLPHDRQAYRQEMGHVRLGTEREELDRWLSGANLRLTRYVALPPDRQAKGPALFAAVCHKT